MTSSVYLDLDGTLIRSYYAHELADLDKELLGQCRSVFRDVFTVPRPGLIEFLDGLSEFADVRLFTAAQLGYAKSVLVACNIATRFKSLHSGQIETPGSIEPSDEWVLVEDTPTSSPITQYKLLCLGTESIHRVLMVPSFQPHIRPDQGELKLALPSIKELLSYSRGRCSF
jgi:hypothetical protein